MTAIRSMGLRGGDRIIVEPANAEPFEATVVICLGWGLVHGVANWHMRKDDGTEFTYGIPVEAPVEVVES